MKNLLITADDFGMCQIVDQAILDLIELGMITTTNVITNMETLKNSALLKEKYPRISVGIHWNVSTGKPTCRPEKVSTLLNENGDFYDGDRFKRRISKGLIQPAQLREEMIRQYELFREYCGEADYWNVHENTVLCRKAYRIFSDVAGELGIRRTRNYQRVYLDLEVLHGLRRAREMLVRRYMDLWYGQVIKRRFSMPEGRIIAFGEKSKTNLPKLMDALQHSPKQNIELVVHPSTGGSHPLFGDMNTQRLKEYEFFKDPNTIEALQKSFHLIGFHDLDEGDE
ncbi:ChbG/HpnK family deacetylase [Alkalibacter rhizosphaerae]|uniref:ChbG/HpnK family deacetylase n=1 Tax=Alkalibacter rhizosphaerae TaxID=2815577 RepID=A0A974XJK6_9FIRM|nr:ChbG/HpnK family deacetylase [Alkalibacter rhizosphaerae]QSX09603.1 ChbG/HpnK family deacetylase [Alkalibacter rhizosphaerae]